MTDGDRKMIAGRSPLGSLAEGGAGLGTIIGEAGARALAAQAGFTGFERLPVDSPTQQFFLLAAPAPGS